MTEMRRFSRVNFDAESFVEFAGVREKAHLMDISLRGALIALVGNPSVKLGDTCKLDIHLDGCEVVLNFEAQVVHTEGEAIGLKFVREDLDTMIHLRRLMEFNTSDPDEIRRELGFLIDAT